MVSIASVRMGDPRLAVSKAFTRHSASILPFLNPSYGEPGRFESSIEFLDLNSGKPDFILHSSVAYSMGDGQWQIRRVPRDHATSYRLRFAHILPYGNGGGILIS